MTPGHGPPVAVDLPSLTFCPITHITPHRSTSLVQETRNCCRILRETSFLANCSADFATPRPPASLFAPFPPRSGQALDALFCSSRL